MCVFDFRQAQPEREVMTGIGPVAVRQPRVRDREADATDPDRIRFSPSASDADEAIDILTSRFAVVFTDIQMPGSMDGLRLAAVVRDRWPPIKIITASGRVRVEQ